MRTGSATIVKGRIDSFTCHGGQLMTAQGKVVEFARVFYERGDLKQAPEGSCGRPGSFAKVVSG